MCNDSYLRGVFFSILKHPLDFQFFLGEDLHFKQYFSTVTGEVMERQQALTAVQQDWRRLGEMSQQYRSANGNPSLSAHPVVGPDVGQSSLWQGF